MNTITERLGIRLPKYYNQNHPEMGKVRVIPLPLWRRLPILKELPFFVGNKMSFILKMDEKPREGYYSPVIYERFAGEETILMRVESNELKVEGNIIPREGDVEYTFGHSETTAWRLKLATTHVKNTDRWSLGCIAFIFGIMATVIAEIILRLIQVEPFWKIWIP